MFGLLEWICSVNNFVPIDLWLVFGVQCYCKTVYFSNSPDHKVIACYLKLYKEGEVEHINGIWPSFLYFTAS